MPNTISRVLPAVLLVATCAWFGTAQARDLGNECTPSGLLAKAREAWDPKAFWTLQLKEIEKDAEAVRQAHDFAHMERIRALLNEQIDRHEQSALGVPPPTPEVQRFLNKADREVYELEQKQYDEDIAWGRRCTAYANQKLSPMK
jgi:hypothetical protein